MVFYSISGQAWKGKTLAFGCLSCSAFTGTLPPSPPRSPPRPAKDQRLPMPSPGLSAEHLRLESSETRTREGLSSCLGSMHEEIPGRWWRKGPIPEMTQRRKNPVVTSLPRLQVPGVRAAGLYILPRTTFPSSHREPHGSPLEKSRPLLPSDRERGKAAPPIWPGLRCS